MKKTRVYAVLLLAVFTCILLAGCSSKGMKMDTAANSVGDMKMERDSEEDMDESSGTFTSTSFSLGNTGVSSIDKIIKSVNMEVETQDFDQLISSLDEEITRLGGYVESSEIRGRRYYSKSMTKYGSVVARIPTDRLDEFVDNVYETSNVVNRTNSSENVTLKYIDTESKKKSLEIEQERLFEILENAGTMEEIIALESRLSSIRYELQNHETQLRTYDNLIDYSTVSISIDEVERITPTGEDEETVFARIKTGFSDTIYNISEGFTNFFIWFIVNIIYIIIWAVIITATVIIFRRFYKKYVNKKYPKQ